MYMGGQRVDMEPRKLRPLDFLKDAGVGSGVLGEDARDESSPTGGPMIGEDAGVVPPPEKVKPVKAAGLSKDDLERNIDIILAETDTDCLLNFPSLSIALDHPQHAAVSARNKHYEELCHSKADSDSYREQHAQTLNNEKKNKEVTAAPTAQQSVEVNANGWDIFDTFATDEVQKHEQIQQACDKESLLAVAQAVKKPGCLFTMSEPYPEKKLIASEPAKKPGNDRGPGRAKRGVGAVAAGASATQTSSGSPSKSLAAGPTAGSGGGGGAAPGQGDVAGADGAGASPEEGRMEQDDEEAPDEQIAPLDAVPWKVGEKTPIPEELLGQLRVMERIVAQNVYHKQHMVYRNYPTLEELAKLDEMRAEELLADLGLEASGNRSGSGAPQSAEGLEGAIVGDEDEHEEEGALEETTHDEGAADKPYLQDLFEFHAPQLTQDMPVTCAEWNYYNQDLLAVSYGDTSPVPNTQGGLVLFWSLKNPIYPERVIRTRSGVTSLHFSSVHGYMVSAGMHDGSVMIWDLRRPGDQPVLRSGSSVSAHSDQKHTDIVWETRWVDRGPDKQPPEVLVSASSDGDVLQWSMKKGLERSLLMQLKRIPNPHLGANSVHGHKEGIVFRRSSGFCIDFPKDDTSTYLVGTEDGLVHRCSTSYTEQYLETFYGHSGPVYRVRCNPFMSSAFLTCSADWTMKLWTTKPIKGHPPDTPLLNFMSTDLNDAVNDVTWEPRNSTSFAAAMDDGRVELWDLAEKPLDPIVVHYPRASQAQRRRTTVRFSTNSPVLIAGDDNGSVDVMRMYNTNQSYYSDQEQQDRLDQVMTRKR
jgi:WD40 repeat protein